MRRLVFTLLLTIPLLSAQATEIGISAEELYRRIDAGDSGLLFVDVRDPVEIMFIGFTDAVHVNIPYLLIDPRGWDQQRGTYEVRQNLEFIPRIRRELERRGLSADAEIITMCRSGSERGEPSADYLRANGFPNARYVVNGFQGTALKDGPQAGFRLQNGWQNSGLPWSLKMNPEKMYLP